MPGEFATYLFPLAFAAMVVAALVLPTSADRARGALGLPAFVLGFTSVPLLPDFQGPSLTVWISAALLLLGPALLVLGAWQARLRLSPRGPVVVSLVLATAASMAAAWPTLRNGGLLPALLTAGSLGLGGLLFWMLASLLKLGQPVRWLDAQLPASRGRYSYGVVVLVAAAVLLRLGALIWPLWALSWQPIGVGVGVLAAWWAVATGRASLALAGAALAASFSTSEGLVGGWLVLAAAALVDRTRPRVIAVAAAAGAYLAAPAVLDAEVLYSVLLAWAATMLLGVLAANTTVEATASR